MEAIWPGPVWTAHRWTWAAGQLPSWSPVDAPRETIKCSQVHNTCRTRTSILLQFRVSYTKKLYSKIDTGSWLFFYEWRIQIRARTSFKDFLASAEDFAHWEKTSCGQSSKLLNFYFYMHHFWLFWIRIRRLTCKNRSAQILAVFRIRNY